VVQAQDRIAKIVKGFRFNLGFSGKYFRHGTADENEGDDTLIGEQPNRRTLSLVSESN